MLLTDFAATQLEAFCESTAQPRVEPGELERAESSPAMHFRAFLDDAEMQQLAEAAVSMGESSLSACGHDVSYSDSHVALNLHRGGFMKSRLPAIFGKITEGMCSEPALCDPSVRLNVRCMEYHTYVAGGGLMTEGHKDHGSALTMSILLSHAHEVGGGALMTWHDGVPVVHDSMQRGDALLFPSLKTHNVSPITRGIRHTLVVEMWRGAENEQNRYR